MNWVKDKTFENIELDVSVHQNFFSNRHVLGLSDIRAAYAMKL